MAKYLDENGLSRFWTKVKDFLTGNYQPKLVSGTNIKTVNNQSLLGSGNIAISDKVIEQPTISISWYNQANRQIRIELYNFTNYIDYTQPILIDLGNIFTMSDHFRPLIAISATSLHNADSTDDMLSDLYDESEEVTIIDNSFIQELDVGNRTTDQMVASDQFIKLILRYTTDYANYQEDPNNPVNFNGKANVLYHKLDSAYFNLWYSV